VIVSTTPALAELVSAYREARDTAKAAADRRDALSATLKQAMLDQALAENPADPLTDTELIAGELKAHLVQQVSWRLNTDALKAQLPEVYAAFAKQSATLVLKLGLA
jgi:hypothetical protein